jgi:hypothetical protein
MIMTQTPELRKEKPIDAVHRPSVCSGVKALRNTIASFIFGEKLSKK